MAKFQAVFLDIETVAAPDLKTAPSADGSDFSEDEIIEPHPQLNRLQINVFALAVASTAPAFRLYRQDPIDGLYYKEALFTVDPAITDSTDGERRALTTIEIGFGRHAIVLEDAEEGSTIRAAWFHVSNGAS